jgi:DNA modification methylase
MPQLTDQEKQEVLRYLEADQPLPDKYRFLLFGDKREVELVWNGKTNEVCNIVLPFQVIEQVDEPRAERADDTALQLDLFSTDSRGRQFKGWTNKLIWGDNKLILSSLKNGPMREEIEAQGGIKLIYIDPPFDVGADFSMDIEVGDDTLTKRPGILEELVYRDTWGQGADSYLSMMYERILLMHDLLAADGCIMVHCDWRLTSHLRGLLDEAFGASQFVNEVVWRYGKMSNTSRRFPRNHDSIWIYAKTDEYYFSPVRGADSEYRTRFERYLRDNKVHWGDVDSSTDKLVLLRAKKVRKHLGKDGLDPHDVLFDFDTEFKTQDDVFYDISIIKGNAEERLDYPTQKPEALIERLVTALSRPGDIVADFFVGSGTLPAVAERLGRKWIASDLGKFAVHTSRKRILGVQRELGGKGKGYRAFEVLNLGRYERQHYVGVNANLREAERQQQLQERERAFLDLILRAYQAEAMDGFTTFHGKKAGRLVAVGPVNLPVTRLFVEEVILECRQKRITRVDILGFEFEMGLFPNVLDEARGKGIDIAPKYIPAEVFDKRAVEANQVVFHDVAFIEVKPHVEAQSVAVELTDFSVFYSQDSIASAEETMKNNRSQVVVERGQIVKVSKDGSGIVTREILTKQWTDWIDYWAVDFNFEHKREIIRVKNEATDEWEEQWTGDYIFENEWQSFRTRKDRSLELRSVAHECLPGPRKLAIKVVDIFGNDTMTIVSVNVGA